MVVKNFVFIKSMHDTTNYFSLVILLLLQRKNILLIIL